MKNILVLIGFLISLSAVADEMCGKFVLCGTYSARGEDLIFADLGNRNVSWIVKNARGSSTIILSLDDNGKLIGDHNRVLGECKDLVCRLSIPPATFLGGDTVSQVITLKFQPDTLEMDKVNISADGVTATHTSAIFPKK